MAGRIARIGTDMLDRHAALVARALARCVLGANVADQRSKAAPQSRAAVVRHVHYLPTSEVLARRSARLSGCVVCLLTPRHAAGPDPSDRSGACAQSIPSRAG